MPAKEKVTVLALLLLSAFMCLWDLGRHEIVEWDESTNLRVVNESLASSDPWFLKLDGGPFLEKPPLWYYLTMGSVKAFGSSNFSLRFVTALAGIALVLLVYWIGREVYSHGASVVASLVLLGTGHLFFFDAAEYFTTHHIRSADGDILQILFIMLAFYAVLRFLGKSGEQKRDAVFPLERCRTWLYLSGFFSGVAVMSKGFLGLLPLLILAVFLLYRKLASQSRIESSPAIKLKDVLITGSLFALVVLPWHVAMIGKFGNGFVDVYAGYHIWERVVVTLEDHSEPAWFYFSVLWNKGVFFGFELFIIAFFVAGWRFVSDRRFAEFSLLAANILILSMITMMQTKLAWYVLPAYPFIALLIAGLYERLSSLPRAVLLCFVAVFVINNCRMLV